MFDNARKASNARRIRIDIGRGNTTPARSAIVSDCSRHRGHGDTRVDATRARESVLPAATDIVTAQLASLEEIALGAHASLNRNKLITIPISLALGALDLIVA